MSGWNPRWRRQHELMDEMMLNAGVDILAAVNRGGFARARANCRYCADFDACKEWLLKDGGALRPPPSFCPNLAFVTTCDSESD